MNWVQYFKMMQDWKKLPAYKAEPRIDSLIGYFMPEIISDFVHEEIVGIIPELPIRLGTVKPQHEGTRYADKSYKVDFYLLGSSGKHYFVEFKTDSGSRRDEQDQYLNEAKAVGMASIVAGISRIASVSSYRKKYAHLTDKLTGLGLYSATNGFAGRSTEIEILYIQPKHKSSDFAMVIDFLWISEWLIKKAGSGEFECEFAKSLAVWSGD